MSLNRRTLELAAVVVLIGVLGQALGHKLVIGETAPNMGLVAAIATSLFAGPEAAAMLGLTLGIIESAYLSKYVGSLLVSRSAVCWAIGTLDVRINRQSSAVASLTALAGTVVSAGIFFVLAPQPHALRFLLLAARESIYNAVLIVPVYMLLARRYQSNSI